LKIATILFQWDISEKYTKELKDVFWTEWYSKYVEYSINNDLIPIVNNCFSPNKNITRYEVIWMLKKLSWN
jgi:hypothetical protein